MLDRVKLYLNYLLANDFYKKYAKILFLDIFSKVADYLLLPIYLVLLTKEEYGFYTYFIFITFSFSGLIKLGLDTALSKMFYLYSEVKRKEVIFNLNLIWVSIYATIFAICLFSNIDNKIFIHLLKVNNSDYQRIYFFLLIYVLFHLIQNTLYTYYVIDNKALNYQRINFLKTVLGNLLLISILKFYPSDNVAFLRITFEPIIFLLIFSTLLWSFVKNLEPKVNIRIIIEGFKIGLPLAGVVMVGAINNLADKYFLQKYFGFENLASYNLAVLLTAPITLIFTSFQTIWLPKFLKDFELNDRIIKTKRIVKTLFVLFILVFFVLFFCLKILFTFNFLPFKYKEVLSILIFIFFGRVAESITGLYNNFIVFWGKTIFNLIVSFILSLISFGLFYFIIPIWGILGSAIIVLFSSFFRFFIYYYYVNSNAKAINSLYIK